jgi:hypothetical protein
MYTPKPENKFTFGLWTVGNIGRDPFGEPVRQAIRPSKSSICWPKWAPGASTSTTTTWFPLTPPRRNGTRIVADFKAGAGRYRPRRAHGDHQPVQRSRFPRWRLHQQRPQRARLRPAKNHERHRPGRGVGRKNLCLLGRTRRVETDAGKSPWTPVNGSATRSISCANTCSIRATT